MNRCGNCGELVERQFLVCPRCRATLVTMAPPSRRPRDLVTLLLMVAAIVAALVVILRALIA